MFDYNTFFHADSLRDNLKEKLNWALDQFLRPALILICGMLLFNLPIFLYKIRLVLTTIIYLLFCNDKKWKRPPDPGAIFGPILSAGKPVERRTIFFVRHGESCWNDTFNKGNHRSVIVFVLGLIPGLFKAVFYEMYLLLSGKMDRYVFVCKLRARNGSIWHEFVSDSSK